MWKKSVWMRKDVCPLLVRVCSCMQHESFMYATVQHCTLLHITVLCCTSLHTDWAAVVCCHCLSVQVKSLFSPMLVVLGCIYRIFKFNAQTGWCSRPHRNTRKNLWQLTQFYKTVQRSRNEDGEEVYATGCLFLCFVLMLSFSLFSFCSATNWLWSMATPTGKFRPFLGVLRHP